jgi:hypothetical protein
VIESDFWTAAAEEEEEEEEGGQDRSTLTCFFTSGQKFALRPEIYEAAFAI